MSAAAPSRSGLKAPLAAPLPFTPLKTFRERKWVSWLLFAADIAVLEVALFLGLLVRDALLPTRIGLEQYTGIAIGVLLVPALLLLMGTYPGYCIGPVERMRRRTYVVVGVFAALTAFDNLVLRGAWSRGVLLSTLLFALVLPPLGEALVRHALRRRGCWGIPVLILGAGHTGTRLAEIFAGEPDLGLVPIGFLDDDESKWGTRIEDVPVAGPIRIVHALRGQARVILLAMPGMSQPRMAELISSLYFARIMIVPNLFGMQTQWVTARDLGGYLGLEIRKNLHVRRNRFVKHVLDYVIGLPALILTAPLIAGLALWIKRASPGPAFYSQVREGHYGEKFEVWKLRTMHPDADRLLAEHLENNPEDREQWNRYFKLPRDPRVIPGVGNLLRSTSLDELPQLWNVARGEMSLVGPRPFPAYHLEMFSPEFRTLRSSVRPGMTGMWQVSRRSDGDLEVQQALDTYYIHNWSVWLDLYLLFRTVRAVVSRSGAY
ncbi:MAG: undecaprenyl-phosphate galactose phosphotransferase WbaP [Bryobacteraceae bacterium]